MLRLDHIAHEYPSQGGIVKALDSLNPISLDIGSGEFVCVVGPSGCGKTTLLHIMAGLITPSHGRITLDGVPVSNLPRRIGLVFQKSNLMPWRTVRENIALPLQLAGAPRAEQDAAAQAMIERMGLDGFPESSPAELSGGMAQRVAIGRALIYDPEVLLLDEPFGALDEMTREQMQLELMRIWSKTQKTAIMVTHSIIEAVFIADRVVVMSPRPGHILGHVPVSLPRPRSLNIVHESSFGDIARRIRNMLNTEG